MNKWMIWGVKTPIFGNTLVVSGDVGVLVTRFWAPDRWIQGTSFKSTWRWYVSLVSRCIYIYLVLQTTIFYWMFGETTISYVKIWNHPIETTIKNCLFGVPGIYIHLKKEAGGACLIPKRHSWPDDKLYIYGPYGEPVNVLYFGVSTLQKKAQTPIKTGGHLGSRYI